MVVTKVGQWSNVEDEVLKAAISKYGLNQWARCASLLAKKTAKQCKARWNEWLDPSIKKTEWSREDDEKLLTMAKLLPTQWRTIAPIVGRTATQCLERYQKLLDEQESRESGDLGLAGPEGGESAAPTADEVRRLRPGEVDAYAESRPARPDAIDMDEEDKEMLSEARARLANVSGKKAKRKARERQLDESRRLALLQKRRELKAAGINIKITPKKGNHIDYNADVPLEKEVPSGFFDTVEELDHNERQREAYDPRKQQLANKRKADQQDDGGESKKKKKDEKAGGLAASYAKAAQMQRIREAEQSSKRRGLVLPAPQVGEAEMEDIVKMGMLGERAASGSNSDNLATRGLVGNYSSITSSTPIRTPMAPKEEDTIANEARNARLRTETQSALLGGDNPDFEEEEAPASLSAPSTRHQIVTPNPLATPFRQGVGATPMRQGPGATPMRTPRDTLRLNGEDGAMQLVGQTPRDIRQREQAKRSDLRSRLAALPKPKEESWEFELPDEAAEPQPMELSEEDAAERDRRAREAREAAERAEFARQTQVVQRFLPRPSVVDIDVLMKRALNISDPFEREVELEMAQLIAHDVKKFGSGQVTGTVKPLQRHSDEALRAAKMELALEYALQSSSDKTKFAADVTASWTALHGSTVLPGIAGYAEDEIDEHQLLAEAFTAAQDAIVDAAERANKMEKSLAKHHGGYIQRGKLLRTKIAQAHAALDSQRCDLSSQRAMMYAEQTAISRRLESLREEVSFVTRREREAQELYRARRDELEGLQEPVNGVH
ncbi:pre-mRNA splicing factor component-domain-containing protein [Boeremia exigua]|uniref:pre-mRNA splicing factor component-domain-containing protein n=1 Tax=Boeremia exigua TaxID=749465 RepID=UPI001E8D56F7|nr:pre-mRNA splicing factor component-domain-containing protein [Boeremia exigua]KAH6615002.1 pre-mRNA splicing factor component-domain-containing protein [Boeremia exigua]